MRITRAWVDDTGKTVFSQRLGNDQAAIEALIARAVQAGEPVRRAIDLTSPMALLLTTVLLAADQAVTYVPGRVVNLLTGRFRGEGKTDAKDAGAARVAGVGRRGGPRRR